MCLFILHNLHVPVFLYHRSPVKAGDDCGAKRKRSPAKAIINILGDEDDDDDDFLDDFEIPGDKFTSNSISRY